MTRRPPNWQRKGYQSDAEYRAACAATRRTKMAALAATKSRKTGRLVLEKMWGRAEFDRPTVVVTKQQLMADVGCCLDTLRAVLRELRQEGSIKPVKNWQGGRGIPTTWALRVAGHETTPADTQVEGMKEARNREAAFRFLAGKYGPSKAIEILDGPE